MFIVFEASCFNDCTQLVILIGKLIPWADDVFVENWSSAAIERSDESIRPRLHGCNFADAGMKRCEKFGEGPREQKVMHFVCYVGNPVPKLVSPFQGSSKSSFAETSRK